MNVLKQAKVAMLAENDFGGEWITQAGREEYVDILIAEVMYKFS